MIREFLKTSQWTPILIAMLGMYVFVTGMVMYMVIAKEVYFK